jgi:sugar phosphate isomerase/epimerase
MIPIAVQLYSVRDEAARDFLGTLEKVAEMGYAGVEFAGYHGHTPEALRAKLDSLGLVTEGTHTGIDQLSDENIDATIALHQTLGTSFVIIPWLPEEMRNTPEACVETGAKLTAIVEKLAPHGLRLGFHAHDGDMKPLAGGESAWYRLAHATPESFIMQYDTANGTHGGADPVQPILDLPGRSVSVHLKEFGGVGVGTGQVPWKAVFEACESVGGTQWYVVEEEAEAGEKALDGIRISIENLRAMGK